ncbi:glucosamine-6-phosphate deaminase [Bacillus timonensis]|uniref:glucosamine-6-phosphate deaminase n=1 Tax=Bacillus timonensis TaxID=1033734 RepID=UPI000289E143|nr:glucosamine-6-phosphate deaminase [Bacillus timonensis]
MKVVAVKNFEEMSQFAAAMISYQVKEKPNSVLGLATGGTVVGTYKELIKDHGQNKTSYENIHTVNLDEYLGIEKDHPNSYHHFMMDNLFSHINITKDNIHIPDGLATDYEEESKKYEKVISDLGGVDLQLLGIGVNGHIGFNEPGTPFQSVTHVVELEESTRQANMRFFNSIEEVPTHAITMGISTIMKSKKILLLVSGKTKADILEKVINKDITERIPATVLKNHPDVTIIADEEALSLVDDEKKRGFDRDKKEFTSTYLLSN